MWVPQSFVLPGGPAEVRFETVRWTKTSTHSWRQCMGRIGLGSVETLGLGFTLAEANYVVKLL
eukprot:11394218-Prorocentrum_lima.AAC.1